MAKETDIPCDGSDERLRQIAFEAFAKAHPHEAYETWPDDFWKFFQRERPGVSRKQMEQWLRETAEPVPIARPNL